MRISPARTAAFDILVRIAKEKAFSSVLLPIFEAQLARSDAALCHEITLGVLRRQLYLDRVIDDLAGGKRLDAEIRVSLWIGLYQLIFLSKIPPHSAVDESVNLVLRAKKRSAKGFVNAILRRFLREAPKVGFIDEIDRISTTTSHPKWLLEKWIRDHGIDTASRLAAANNDIPRSAFRILRESAAVDELTGNCRRSEDAPGCWVIEKPDQRFLKLAEEGAIYLQDEGSQIVGSAVNVPDRGRFFDVCAAPGGKTGLIARKSPHGSLIVAGDLHRTRAGHLLENCERQVPGRVSVFQYDAVVSLPFTEKSFDAVLVDAPCSGTGTIRHNPELRYFLEESDLAELQKKQLAILENASKVVVSGGELIYSTCSLEPEENEQIAADFLDRNPDYRVVPPRVSGRLVTTEGFARTWPHRDGVDGFFIAAFKRAN
jgi:16S rRNA (cytosine967-C5)-methyltransferase